MNYNICWTFTFDRKVLVAKDDDELEVADADDSHPKNLVLIFLILNRSEFSPGTAKH